MCAHFTHLAAQKSYLVWPLSERQRRADPSQSFVPQQESMPGCASDFQIRFTSSVRIDPGLEGSAAQML